MTKAPLKRGHVESFEVKGQLGFGFSTPNSPKGLSCTTALTVAHFLSAEQCRTRNV